MQVLSSDQTSPEIPINENGESVAPAALYGKRHPVTTGLTWGYWGGYWGATSVADGTLALTNNATNYVVVNRSTGAISASTATTNWDNTADYARAHKITTSGGVVTAWEDQRVGPYGTHGYVPVGGGAGRHAVPIMAASMRPSVSGGCASLAAIVSAANQPDIVSLDFDATTQEYAQFSVPMPKSWDEGTITFKAIWSHPATATNFGVVWDLQAVAISDNEAFAVSYGTAQTSTDTGGTTDRQYISPESSAITVAGSPAAEDVVHFRISRVTGNGSDTMAVDARLHGIVLFINTNAETDA